MTHPARATGEPALSWPGLPRTHGDGAFRS